MGRQGRVRGPPPQRPIPVLARLWMETGVLSGYTFCPISRTIRQLYMLAFLRPGYFVY